MVIHVRCRNKMGELISMSVHGYRCGYTGFRWGMGVFWTGKTLGAGLFEGLQVVAPCTQACGGK